MPLCSLEAFFLRAVALLAGEVRWREEGGEAFGWLEGMREE